MKTLKVRTVINKKNNQINVSLPRKSFSKSQLLQIKKMKFLEIKIKGIL